MPEPANDSAPPPIIQDPHIPVTPVLLAKKSGSTNQFDVTKVLAAVGLILTVTIIIVGILWITVQNLENRVNNLEQDLSTVPVNQKSAASAAAKLATAAAEKTASSSSQ